MHQTFTLQNLYVILTHRTHNKYQGVYLLDGTLYLLNVKSDKFNRVRDLLRENLTPSVGMDVVDAINITPEWVIHQPKDFIKDIFRVTNGNRVRPNYSGKGTYIAGSDGYTEQEILSMADQDFPLTIGATHRSKDNAEALAAFQAELSNTPLADQLVSALQVETTSRVEPQDLRLPPGLWLVEKQGEPARMVHPNQSGFYGVIYTKSTISNKHTASVVDLDKPIDPLADQAAKYPAYWKGLPKNWAAIDTYRIDVLFPLNDSRLTHARKKLLVPGTRTGGKSFRHDIKEAWATLDQWLQDNPED